MPNKPCDQCRGRRVSKKFKELAGTFGDTKFKICSCETESSSTRSSGIFSNEDIPEDHIDAAPPSVVLKGQGRGQGVVYMDKNGELTFSKGDEKQGEGFIFTSVECQSKQCYTIESVDHKGRFLVVDKYTVRGEKPVKPDAAYWRKPSYTDVSGDRNANSSWFCLLYWGDKEFRSPSPNFNENYFLVVNGIGSSARFTIGPKDDLLKKQNGIFSILE